VPNAESARVPVGARHQGRADWVLRRRANGDERTIEHDAAAPADGHDRKADGRGNSHFAGIARKIVDAQRRSPRTRRIGPRDERRCDRMLHGRADPGEQDHRCNRGIALRCGEHGKADAGKHRACGEQRAIADAFSQDARRQLQTCQCGGIGHAQRADLHVGEPE
jgi:hypothetical protein